MPNEGPDDRQDRVVRTRSKTLIVGRVCRVCCVGRVRWPRHCSDDLSSCASSSAPVGYRFPREVIAVAVALAAAGFVVVVAAFSRGVLGVDLLSDVLAA